MSAEWLFNEYITYASIGGLFLSATLGIFAVLFLVTWVVEKIIFKVGIVGIYIEFYVHRKEFKEWRKNNGSRPAH